MLVFLVDGALIWLALTAAGALYDVPWHTRHSVAATLAILFFSVFGEALGMHRAQRGAPLKQEVFRVWTTWAAVIAALVLVAFFLKLSADFSRVAGLLWFTLAPVFLTLWRTVLRLFLEEIRQRGWNTRNVAIVGATATAERLAHEISSTPWLGLRILGFYDDRRPEPKVQVSSNGAKDGGSRVHPIPPTLGEVRGNFDQLLAEAREGIIDTVYVALPLRAEPRIRDLIAKLADTTVSVHVVADLFMSDLLQSRWTNLGQMPVLSVFDTPFYGVDGWLKRVEDILLGTVILAFLAVPMAIVAFAVKLTSRGPVLFRQRRYGLNGEPITVLKFRTMTVCEDGDQIQQARKDDPRVTKLGSFLRRTSLDELPQFLNVLTGEMSIVGPRPHAVAHNELYRKQIRGYMLRHKVKPGITGWAQVNGWRGETDTLEKMQKRIEYDLNYIGSWGLWFDLKIIFLTIFGAAVRKNAH